MKAERKRNRLKDFDYSQNGFYFLTICTYERKEIFGKIKERRCNLNKYGKIVLKTLNEFVNKYSYLALDYFIIMPDHLHLIMVINSIEKEKIKSLSEIIGAIKTVSSKHIHPTGYKSFRWQRSFYDRIIRNEKELYRIRNYIKQNPLTFEIDKIYSENLD